MIETIAHGALLASVVILSIILHEMGHALVMRLLIKQWPKFRFVNKDFLCGTPEQTKALSDEQYFRILIGGVVSGFIPILMFTGPLSTWEILIIIILYLAGSRSDLVQIWKFAKDEEEEEQSKYWITCPKCGVKIGLIKGNGKCNCGFELQGDDNATNKHKIQ